MFGTSDRRARKTAMKAFKKQRRDMFEGLDSQGRSNVANALRTRLNELRSRTKNKKEADFRNSPFVMDRVNQFAKIIADEQEKQKNAATKALQEHINAERNRFKNAVAETKAQERKLKKMGKDIRITANVLIDVKADLKRIGEERVKLRKNRKKLMNSIAREAAKKSVDNAAKIRKAKKALDGINEQLKAVESQVKSKTIDVNRLEKEKQTLQDDMANERESLAQFEEELELRSTDVEMNEAQLQIKVLNQMAYMGKFQAENALMGIMASFPVSVESVPPFFRNEFKGMMDQYAFSCESTADVLAQNAMILSSIKTSGVLDEAGAEVFAFGETAEEYLMQLIEIMQDLTDKANRASTALVASTNNFTRLQKFFKGIKPNMPPWEVIDFALSVKEAFDTFKQSSAEIVSLVGKPSASVNESMYIKSRLAKYLTDAVNKADIRAEDGLDLLAERIEAVKIADKIDSPLLWYRGTNEQYNEIIGETDFDEAMATVDKEMPLKAKIMNEKLEPKKQKKIDVTSAGEILDKFMGRIKRKARVKSLNERKSIQFDSLDDPRRFRKGERIAR